MPNLSFEMSQLLYVVIGAVLTWLYHRLTPPAPSTPGTAPAPGPALPALPTFPFPLPGSPQQSSSAESLLVAGGHPIAAMILQLFAAALKTGLPAIAAKVDDVKK